MGLLGNLIEPNPDNGLLNLSLNLARAGGQGQPLMGGIASSIQQTQQDTMKMREYQRQRLRDQLRDTAIDNITDPMLKELAYIDPDGYATVLAAKLRAERGWDGRDRSPYFQYIATKDGIYRFNARTGEMSKAPLTNADGSPTTPDDILDTSGSAYSDRPRSTSGLPPAPGDNNVLTRATDPTLERNMSKANAVGTGEGKIQVAKPAEKARILNGLAAMDRLRTSIKSVREHPGLDNITGTFMGIEAIPSIRQESVDAEGMLSTLKNQTFIDTIQAMRDMSQTGGAVGNVSDKEGDRMENARVALLRRQGTPQFKAELEKYERDLEGAMNRVRAAYQEQYGETLDDAFDPAAETPPTPTGGASPYSNPDLENEYQQWKRQQRGGR